MINDFTIGYLYLSLFYYQSFLLGVLVWYWMFCGSVGRGYAWTAASAVGDQNNLDDCDIYLELFTFYPLFYLI